MSNIKDIHNLIYPRINPYHSVQSLVQTLQQSHSKYKSRKFQSLLKQKRQSLKAKRSLIPLNHQHPNIIINTNSNLFSNSSFINQNLQFTQYQIRKNLIVPQRAFSSIPNIKIGLDSKQVFGQPKHSISQSQSIISKKFQQYNTIIDSQDGKLKKKYIQQKHIKIKRSIPKVLMKKTFFSKPARNEYNFYDNGSMIKSQRSNTIFDLTSTRKLTEKIKTRQFQKLITQISEMCNNVRCKNGQKQYN